MSQTRPLPSSSAGTRRGSMGVWSVVVAVFALLSVHVLCGIHLDDVAAGSSHTHDVVAGSTATSAEGAQDAVVSAPGSATAPAGDDHGCSDHHVAVAQCDPVLPTPLVAAVLPERVVQRVAPAAAYAESRTATNVARAAAPSLHALGISRT